MKDLSLANLLRYVFPSLVAYAYLYLSGADKAAALRDSLKTLDITVLVFLGSVAYLVYRALFYSILFVRLQDAARRGEDKKGSDNYRTYLKKRYKISTHEAELLWTHIRDRKFKDDYPSGMREAAGGVHLLYIAGLMAIAFIPLNLNIPLNLKSFLFPVLAIIFLFSGVLFDRHYEDVETRLLYSLDDNDLDGLVKRILDKTGKDKE